MDDEADAGRVLRSAELAELAGTTPRALRHYHRIQLLPEPPRDRNGYRRYSVSDLVRVLQIRQLSASGVPLREVGKMLDQHRHLDDDLLDKLERNLVEQAALIEQQRRVIARLRGLALPVVGISDGMSSTERLDRDVWTLLTETGSVDDAAAKAMTDALGETALAEQAATWMRAFTELEQMSAIEDDEAEALAQNLVAFAVAVLDKSAITPVEEALPIAGLVHELWQEGLSPAQQQVWERFRGQLARRGLDF